MHRNDYRNYLAHHGILGMHWGKRFGPPYPLGSGDHSVSEKKAGWRKSLGGAQNEQLYGRKKKSEKSITKSDRNRANSSKGRNSKSAIASKTERYTGAIAGGKAKTREEINRDLLKKNPNAAVANPDFLSQHKKAIIAGAVGIGLVAIGSAYAYHRFKNGQIPPIPPKPNDLNLAKEFVQQNAQMSSPTSGGLNGFTNTREQFVANWLKADSVRYKAITPQELSTMSNESVVLKKGAEMYRMSQEKFTSLRSDFEYISFNEADRTRYKGFLPAMWEINGGRKVDSAYEMLLSAKEEIRAPGKKDSFMLMEKALKKAYPGHTDNVYRNDMLKNFYQYQAQLIQRDHPLCKAYAEELKKAGYNAMIDFNDAARLSDKPLILLNGAGSAHVKDSVKISRQAIQDSLNNAKPLKEFADMTADDFKSLDAKNFGAYGEYLKKFCKY